MFVLKAVPCLKALHLKDNKIHLHNWIEISKKVNRFFKSVSVQAPKAGMFKAWLKDQS